MMCDSKMCVSFNSASEIVFALDFQNTNYERIRIDTQLPPT